MELINSVEYKRLQEIEHNKKLITTEYLKDLQNSTTNFVFNQFFGGETTDVLLRAKAIKKLELLNLTYSLPYKIATIKAKYVGKPETNLKIKQMPEQIFAFIYGGYSIFVIDEISEKGEPIINYYGPEQYIDNGDTQDILVALKDEDDRNYLLIKTFSKGSIENNLYKLGSGNIETLSGTKVGLNTLSETENLKDVENFGTDKNLIVRIDDFKITNENYGDSQLTFVKSLLSSLDIELVNIQDQYLKHLQAKLVLQGLDGKMPTDDDGNVNVRDAEVILIENGANKPEFLSNKNDMLASVGDTIDNYIKQIATALSIPPELVGLSGQTGTESTESKLLRYSDFTKDIEYIQDKLNDAFLELSEIVISIKADYFNGEKIKEFFVIFQDVMPTDPLAKANELNIALMGGFISRYTAVKEYTGLTGDGLDEELTRIQEDEARSMANNSLI